MGAINFQPNGLNQSTFGQMSWCSKIAIRLGQMITGTQNIYN